jgi:two-component system, sensor histidine kinase LadS
VLRRIERYRQQFNKNVSTFHCFIISILLISSSFRTQLFASEKIIWTSVSQLQSKGFYKNHGISKETVTIGIINDIAIEGDLYLRVNNPHINLIRFYSEKDPDYIITGDIYPFTKRPVFFSDFILPVSSIFSKTDTAYLSLDKRNENLSYLLEIIDRPKLRMIQFEQSFLLGMTMSLTVILMIYFIILGFLGNKLYNFLFSLYILSTGIWFLNNGGFLFQFLWPQGPYFHNISRTIFSTIAITAFSAFILDYYKQSSNIFRKIIKYIVFTFMPIRILALFVRNEFHASNDTKFIFLFINAVILSFFFISLIIFLSLQARQKNKWLHNIGFLLYAVSLFLEVGHQYAFDPFPMYHKSVFFPYMFLIGQILLIGLGNLLALIKTNKLIAQRKFQELINIDNDLAKKIIAVQEDERALLGEELHDKIGSTLSISRVKVETIQKKYPDFKGNKELDDITESLNSIIREIRFIISSLVLIQTDNKSTKDIFESLVNQFQSISSFTIEFNYDLETDLPSNLNIHLYRVVNEMLTNTLKHSACTRVQIRFFISNNQTLELSYTENVKGFDYVAEPHHYGIKNIMHRISYLKGDFQKINSDQEMTYKIKIHLYES